MRSLLLLPLLLGFSVPAFAHNEANSLRNDNGNCLNLVANIPDNTKVAGAAGCAGTCSSGKTCRDAFNSKYVCCYDAGNSQCKWILNKLCDSKC
tara:strand:- start:145 stop:426 length:282 start_codon:yes stop_codon:yes gene_type:complete